jgi:AcrR family transcriptional regulator
MIRKRRTYTLHKRAQAAQDTRLSIVEATRSLLEETGYPDISLNDIARKAGVSRQTIYVQFGSKSGVLQAVGEHIEHAALEGLIPTLLQASNPVEALRLGLQRVVRFYEHDDQVLRNLHAQTVYDASYATVWRDKQQEIWRNTRRLVEWLDREGCLAASWNVEEATDWLWAANSFESYHQLVGERGWTAEQFVLRIMQLVEKTLLAHEDGAHPRE